MRSVVNRNKQYKSVDYSSRRVVNHYYLYLFQIIFLIISFASSPAKGLASGVDDIKLHKSVITKHQATEKTDTNKSTATYEEVNTLSLKQIFNTKSDWHVTAFQLKQDENNYFETSDLPAKLCFWTDIAKKDHYCFSTLSNEDKSSAYTEVIKLTVVTIQTKKEPTKGLLFIRAYRGPTVGAIYNVTIWAYDHKNDKIRNILPNINLTNQSEYKIYPSMKNLNGGKFVMADRIWADREDLYGPHKFKISIYNLSETDNYELLGQYVTSKKYNSSFEDDADEVIEPELSNIKKYIGKYKVKYK